MWDLPPISAHDVYIAGVPENDCERNLPKYHYSDPDGSNTYHTISGTQHTRLGDADRIDPLVAEWLSPIDGRNTAGTNRAGPVDPPEDYLPRTFTEVSRSLGWVACGYNPTYNHGALVETEMGIKLVDAASNPDPTTPNVLNPQRSNLISGYVTGAPIFGFFARQAGISRVDWRDLGVKVGLYEDLRHRDVLQPTGVGWAWSRKSCPPERVVLPLCRVGQWHYDATFVSSQALAASIQANGGRLAVGRGRNPQMWDLDDGSVKIVALPDAGYPGDTGLAIWILAHLTYPLAWVGERHEITSNGQTFNAEWFVRTAGLVDMTDMATKIVFLLPSQDRVRVNILGTSFEVGRTDRHGVPDANHPPTLYNADSLIENLLHACLSSNNSLRTAFTRYATSVFDGGLNWLEVDTIVSALTVRWHQNVECYYDEAGGKLGRGAPEYVLDECFGLEADDEGQAPARIADYGAKTAVTSLDYRVGPRVTVRSQPHIIIGKWTNMADITVGTGVCRYKAYDMEDQVMVNARCMTGLHDRAMRASFLRKILESFKRDGGIRDEIAFPGQHEMVSQYWDRFVSPPEGVGLVQLARTIIAESVGFSWNSNLYREPRGGTLTGLRTASSFWRTTLNTEWGGFALGGTGRTTGAGYLKDDRVTSWSYNMWLQPGQGSVDGDLEDAMGRLNPYTRNWGYLYQSHPNNTRREGYAFVVETNRSSRIGRDAGWIEQFADFSRDKYWGWGVPTLIRDWAHSELISLVIPSFAAIAMCAADYMPDTWLSRGCSEGPAGPGLRRDYIGRQPTWTLEAISKRLTISTVGHPNTDRQEQSPDVPAQITIEALQKQIADLTAAANDWERVVRNYQDQDGPGKDAELRVLGTTSSGQSVVDPITAAGVSGKYSRVITGTLVPTLEEEAVVAPASIAAEGLKQTRARADLNGH